MNYRCPKCRKGLSVRKLFFSDISACKSCGQKVVLGDFLAFFIASTSMMIMALSSLYLLTQRLDNNIVAGGYALSIGMVTGLVILVLLGRATPHRSLRRKPSAGGTPSGAAPLGRGGAKQR